MAKMIRFRITPNELHAKQGRCFDVNQARDVILATARESGIRIINPTIATTTTITTTFGSSKLWLPTTSAAAIFRCAVASASTGRVSLLGPPSTHPMQNPNAMNRSAARMPRVPKTWRTLSKFTTVISTINRMRLILESQSSVRNVPGR